MTALDLRTKNVDLSTARGRGENVLRHRPVNATLVIALAAALISPSPGPALAQMPMAHHGMGLHTETPPDALPPAQQLTGIGNVSIRITATAEAQRWFDQGLNLLEDFWDYESARAFEQSVRVDPKCAMCYWGLYQAESFYHSTAQD